MLSLTNCRTSSTDHSACASALDVDGVAIAVIKEEKRGDKCESFRHAIGEAQMTPRLRDCSNRAKSDIPDSLSSRP
ncbi:Uncharacterised protein [Serratia marcescens]|nr:Uncharacterised protein [Serratia marcescens]CVA03354.1 Uncharacterised protein [Serratia marcescens]CVA05379.1 Uncharacterised protein [Serratia marcescens]CVB73257.1 Uncharacterised protein [Serratia marcescens]CVB73406.1 Uncharacterised protein [Serratia marcescens]